MAYLINFMIYAVLFLVLCWEYMNNWFWFLNFYILYLFIYTYIFRYCIYILAGNVYSLRQGIVISFDWFAGTWVESRYLVLTRYQILDVFPCCLLRNLIFCYIRIVVDVAESNFSNFQIFPFIEEMPDNNFSLDLWIFVIIFLAWSESTWM